MLYHMKYIVLLHWLTIGLRQFMFRLLFVTNAFFDRCKQYEFPPLVYWTFFLKNYFILVIVMKVLPSNKLDVFFLNIVSSW